MKIALISDPHYSTDETGSAPLFRRRLEAVIDAVLAERVDGVLMAGDLTESGTPSEIEGALGQLHRLSLPLMVVPGNHDVGGKIVPGRSGQVSQAQIDQFEAVVGASCQTQEYGSLRVIGMNASILGSGLPAEAEQWEFLNGLAGSQERRSLLLLHYPLFLESPEEPSDPYWNVEPVPRARLLKLLPRLDVRAVLSGHIHRPLYHLLDGIQHITAPAISFGLPARKQPEGWTLLTVSAEGEITAELRYLRSFELARRPLLRLVVAGVWFAAAAALVSAAVIRLDWGPAAFLASILPAAIGASFMAGALAGSPILERTRARRWTDAGQWGAIVGILAQMIVMTWLVVLGVVERAILDPATALAAGIPALLSGVALLLYNLAAWGWFSAAVGFAAGAGLRATASLILTARPPFAIPGVKRQGME